MLMKSCLVLARMRSCWRDSNSLPLVTLLSQGYTNGFMLCEMRQLFSFVALPLAVDRCFAGNSPAPHAAQSTES